MTEAIINEGSPLGYSQGYSEDIDAIRQREYPMLSGTSHDSVTHYFLTAL
jgi:hypothetical protein